MSILKSTRSGMYVPLSDSILEQNGYERRKAKFIVAPHETRFYNINDNNLFIDHVRKSDSFIFTLEPEMLSSENDKPLYSDTLVLKNLADVKLLEEWWFCEDDNKIKQLEKQILGLRAFGMNDHAEEAAKMIGEEINRKIVERLFKISEFF